MAMTLLPEPHRRRPVAIGLLLAALVVFYLLFLHGFVVQHLDYGEQIDDMLAQEQRFRAKALERPALEARLAEIRQQEAGNSDFLPEQTFDLAAASLNSRLKQVIVAQASDQQRCQVISSQNERAREPELYERVTIKVRMRCDLPDLAKILHVLETQSPSLRVTDLNLFQQVFTGVGGANMLGSMDIRFDLSGYIRKPGGQA
ncbi:MAG: hypothetical protein KDI51_07550 [Xanthomonadales bacterium]|nr:hypothetical protein [Xanthomonadales bacterium]MCB1634430.1 hypothetical protein [Xanthomonadales bacterium]